MVCSCWVMFETLISMYLWLKPSWQNGWSCWSHRSQWYFWNSWYCWLKWNFLLFLDWWDSFRICLNWWYMWLFGNSWNCCLKWNFIYSFLVWLVFDCNLLWLSAVLGTVPCAHSGTCLLFLTILQCSVKVYLQRFHIVFGN